MHGDKWTMDDKPEKLTCRAALLNKNKKAKWSYYILPPYHCMKGEEGCCQDGLTEGRKMSSKK